ncbi:MAG: NADH-quinone oxidoreductase subunit C [Candidatus Glassbacteria bacterium]|nr:NADH-quinone oxidoreductase subunit C [Candidatus Glassbacteria bacterium]
MEPANDHKTLQALAAKFGDSVIEHGVDRGDAVAVIDPGAIHDVIAWLREEHSFAMLVDLCGVDYLPRRPRFEVVYQLHAMTRNERIRLRVQLEGKSPEVATITDLYPVADWLERETWDMFGIVFSGHPDLKRLLMYEPFEGHPLRRDYPINKRQPLIGPRN